MGAKIAFLAPDDGKMEYLRALAPDADVAWVDSNLGTEEQVALMQDAVVIFADGKVEVAVARRCPNLKLVQVSSAGTDRLDVAGLAALVRQRFPEYSPAQVVTYLKEHADRHSNPNNTWGHGFIKLLPPASSEPTPTPIPTDTPTATPDPATPAPTPPATATATPVAPVIEEEEPEDDGFNPLVLIVVIAVIVLLASPFIISAYNVRQPQPYNRQGDEAAPIKLAVPDAGFTPRDLVRFGTVAWRDAPPREADGIPRTVMLRWLVAGPLVVRRISKLREDWRGAPIVADRGYGDTRSTDEDIAEGIEFHERRDPGEDY